MTSTDGVFVCVACLLDDRAHLGHGFDGDDALDGKVRLVTDSQAICRRPVSSTIVSHGPGYRSTPQKQLTDYECTALNLSNSWPRRSATDTVGVNQAPPKKIEPRHTYLLMRLPSPLARA
jgi:hypothetical protein